MIRPGVPVSPLAADDDDNLAAAPTPGKELREAAHEYLENGLLPVPAWAARQNGECCCPRGAGCDRPGKHPRSVRNGPGSREYSWKPLACRTHSEIDQRFAPAGEYAAGNLMVAIPAEMMAIDRDDDDGGRAAFAELAEELGELPPTLAHRTPHGEHLIYRTPPGWTGRAWVGKDPANPVPPGVDLRMPGQILMAAPSIVPGPDGPARYGPITGDNVAALPALYVTAWTPPQPQPRPAGRRVPIPPEGADRAARYVHDAMTRIAADLASRQPGGRNAAAYAAGLKAGSLLGAARATSGAEQAAAAWTDEAAEEALMDAAERNGYTGKDGQPEALRAIRSGLRNGLRNPRALPDFTADTRPGQIGGSLLIGSHPPAPLIRSAAGPRSRADGGQAAGRTWWPMTSAGRSRPPTRPPATGAAPRSPLTSRRWNGITSPPPQVQPLNWSGPGPRPTRRTGHTPTTAVTSLAATRRHAPLGRRNHRPARAECREASPGAGRQRAHAGKPSGGGRQRGIQGRGPGPGPGTDRAGRRARPVPVRTVAAAPQRHRRPAADPVCQGRARCRRP